MSNCAAVIKPPGLENCTLQGPLTFDHCTLVAAPSEGIEMSIVPVSAALPGRQITWSSPASTLKSPFSTAGLMEMEMAAGSESADPSLALNRNASSPKYPGLGV